MTAGGPSQAGFGIDFSVYWSAASVALAHGPAAVFDRDLMMAVERTVRSGGLFEGTSGPWLSRIPSSYQRRRGSVRAQTLF